MPINNPTHDAVVQMLCVIGYRYTQNDQQLLESNKGHTSCFRMMTMQSYGDMRRQGTRSRNRTCMLSISSGLDSFHNFSGLRTSGLMCSLHLVII